MTHSLFKILVGPNKKKKLGGVSYWGKKMLSPCSPPFDTTNGI